MEESQNALNKERKRMNELKDPKKKKKTKKDERNLQLIHHGVNTQFIIRDLEKRTKIFYKQYELS